MKLKNLKTTGDKDKMKRLFKFYGTYFLIMGLLMFLISSALFTCNNNKKLTEQVQLKEQEFKKVIKIDLNSAYWQTCRFMRLVDKSLYQKVSDRCVKSTRLMMAGTLGKTVMITEYKQGVRVKSYVKERDTRRIVQHNIYNRIRKFVDELMIWAWHKDPHNFIGYYVDCIWFREADWEILKTLESIYKLKIEVVD